MEFVGAFLAKQPDQSHVNDPERANCPFAYISLLTDDSYFPGISVLAKSLKATRTIYPFVVLLGVDVSQATEVRLKAMCDLTIRVTNIACPYSSSSPSNTNSNSSSSNSSSSNSSNSSSSCWVNAELTKLHVWNLTQYRKIVYLDADTLVMENIDELFSITGPFAAAPDIFPPDKFNAAVMVIEPSENTFQAMIAGVGILPSHDGADTGFLNSFFPHWFSGPAECRLPFGYNAQRTLHWFTYAQQPGYWQSIKPLKVIHYSSSPKPWKINPSDGQMGELEWIWWRCNMGI